MWLTHQVKVKLSAQEGGFSPVVARICVLCRDEEVVHAQQEEESALEDSKMALPENSSHRSLLRIRRTGETIDLALVKASREARKRLLAPHAGSNTAECLCASPSIPMTIGRRQATEIRAETWFLRAATIKDASRHAQWCLCRGNWSDNSEEEGDEAGDRGRGEPNIALDGDKTIIDGEFSQTWADVSHGSAVAEADRDRAGKQQQRRRYSKLSLVLWALWSRAGLNAWSPSEPDRSYGYCRDALRRGASSVVLQGNAGQRTIVEDLYIPPTYHSKDTTRSDAFIASLEAALGANRVLFVGGLIKKISDAGGGALDIGLAHTYKKLHIQSGLAQRLERGGAQWAGGLGGDAKANPRFIMARCRLAEDEASILCLDAIVMPITESWMPIDSSYEATFVRAAIAQGRGFIKPFPVGNHDPVWLQKIMDRLEVVPDFVLTDTKSVWCEVLGRMADPEYADHAREKMDRYQADGRRVWAWDPVAHRQMPELPL